LRAEKSTFDHMATESQIRSALAQKLLSRRNYEDPKRCELHAYILSRLKRWKAPPSTRGWAREAQRLRKALLRDVFFKGLPLSLLRLPPKIQWMGTVTTGHGYRVRKLRYEGYPGMWIPALLYEPTSIKGRIPVVLNPNGHHLGGKSMDYKQARCINLAKRGMLALNTEFIGMSELSMDRDHSRIAHLDLCGVAGVSAFYLAMKRGLDVLLSHRNADPNRVAMTGLSGGGWQTAILSAIDERITVVVPVAGHSPVWQRVNCAADIGDLEQIPVDQCTVADYDLLTALFAPRPALLIYNLRDDCCFRSRRTYRSVYKPVKPVYESLGVGDDFRFYENSDPGTHNYESDSRGRLYRFLNDQFDLDTPEQDLPFKDELLSERDATVGLPQDNETLLSLAQNAANRIALKPLRGKTQIHARRRELSETIVLRRNRPKDQKARPRGDLIQHRLGLGSDWTVPISEIPGRGRTSLILADGGRPSMTPRIAALAQTGRLMAADVYGTGESWIPSNLDMTLSVTGERPLGILVGQIMDVAAWAGSSRPVHLDATGPVVSFAALCAAALDPSLFSSLYVNGLHDSLRRLIDTPIAYNDAVPLFCFGLLKVVDVPQLVDMTEGLPIEWLNRGPVYSSLNQDSID
jgi:hypothetical protein